MYAKNQQPAPLVTPVTQPFFEAAQRDELILPCCPRDGFFFYPRECCPDCLKTDWQWQPAERTGTVYSFTIDRVGFEPGLRSQVPFAIAVVDLDAGVRLIGRIAGDHCDNISVGSRVEVCFEQIDEHVSICFKPA